MAAVRTGLTKVGLPGASVGLHAEDRTIAEFLKPLGDATGQYGKNHLGDQDRFLPTAHGFDEFFGNLYHLNAEEEPENEDYPKDPAFRKQFGPRGVLRATADGKVEDTGPLTRKRMETVDEEFLGAAKTFIEKNARSNTPFFVWFNSTRMHVFTHLKPSSAGKTGLGLQADGMVEHDGQVGELLKLLDDLKITDNTIVLYSTDNGAMKNQWPDGGSSPFRSEKDTGWEGAVRVPAMIRWPGRIKPGSNFTELFSAEDWLPTLVAAAGGDANLRESATKGVTAHFVVQLATGMDVWRMPLTPMRAPVMIDLKSDPYEYSWDASAYWEKWMIDRSVMVLPAVREGVGVPQVLQGLPPSAAASQLLNRQVIDKLEAATKTR